LSKKYLLLCGAAMFASSTLVSVSASAQTAGSGTEADQALDEGDVIVVTANKREQSVLDVALTVNALAGDELASKGVASGEDLVGLFPNISASTSNTSTTNFNIRGIATNNFQGNVNRSIGIYVDDVTVAHAFSGVLGVFDQERVEVLRGPQNTLNGRNTTGGAINYISRKPTPGGGLEGSGRLTYGRFNRVEVEGALGFGLSDTIGVRLSGQTQQQDGPFRNIAPGRVGERLGEVDRSAFRGQLLWQPSDNTDVLLQFRWGQNRGTETGNLSNGFLEPGQDFTAAATSPSGNAPLLLCQNIAAAGVFGGAQSPCVDIFGTPGSANWREIANVSSAQANIDTIGGTFRIDHDFGFANLTSITAYDDVKAQIADETLGTIGLQFVPFQDSKHKSFQQEIRLVSDDANAFRWIVGGYYFREDLEQGINVRQDQNPLNSNPGPGFGVQVVAFNQLNQIDEDISVFAQADFDVSDRLTISGGLRYTNNVKTAESIFGVVPAPINDRAGVGPNANLGVVPGVPLTQFIGTDFVQQQLAAFQAAQGGVIRRNLPPPFLAAIFSNEATVFGAVPDGPELRQEINRLSGDLTLKYELSDDTNIFARYARGFKSGAFDTRALAALQGTGANLPVGPETLNAYEIGLKSAPSRDLQFNVSTFYYDQQDLQVFSVVQPEGPRFVNLPASEVFGVEADVIWKPLDNTTIMLAGGYLDTKITDSGGLPGFDNGHVLENAAKFSFSASASQNIFLGDNRLNLDASFRYIGAQQDNLTFAEDILSRKPVQTYVDLRASMFFGPDEKYELSIYGRNLTGEKYCSQLEAISTPLNAIGGIQNIAGATISANTPTGHTVNCQPGNPGVPLWGASFGFKF
jgi:iron complex outermembrane recepter protein